MRASSTPRAPGPTAADLERTTSPLPMKFPRPSLGALALLLCIGCATGTIDSPPDQGTAMLDSYIEARRSEFTSIEPERREQLEELADLLVQRRSDGDLSLVFICTHNSRRSQMAQVWARIAAERGGVDGVETYSGGTEVTAFNPRAVAALGRAGVEIEQVAGGDNPLYEVRTPGSADPLECSSKVFDDPANPASDFIAVMTCSSADRTCPLVPGARDRFALTYVDPKAHDGTDREAAAYDERCAQIAREMLFVFDRVSSGA